MFCCYMVQSDIHGLIVWCFVTGYLVMSCNYTLFNELIEFLLNELIKNTSTSTTRTYIQCVGAIR